MILLLIPLQLSAYVQKGGVLSYDNTVRQWNSIFNNRKVTASSSKPYDCTEIWVRHSCYHTLGRYPLIRLFDRFLGEFLPLGRQLQYMKIFTR